MFTVNCSPGRGASVDVRQIAHGWRSLVLTMDPGRVVIDVPPVNGGGIILARFCLDLADGAARLSSELGGGR